MQSVFSMVRALAMTASKVQDSVRMTKEARGRSERRDAALAGGKAILPAFLLGLGLLASGARPATATTYSASNWQIQCITTNHCEFLFSPQPSYPATNWQLSLEDPTTKSVYSTYTWSGYGRGGFGFYFPAYDTEYLCVVKSLDDPSVSYNVYVWSINNTDYVGLQETQTSSGNVSITLAFSTPGSTTYTVGLKDDSTGKIVATYSGSGSSWGPNWPNLLANHSYHWGIAQGTTISPSDPSFDRHPTITTPTP